MSIGPRWKSPCYARLTFYQTSVLHAGWAANQTGLPIRLTAALVERLPTTAIRNFQHLGLEPSNWRQVGVGVVLCIRYILSSYIRFFFFFFWHFLSTETFRSSSCPSQGVCLERDSRSGRVHVHQAEHRLSISSCRARHTQYRVFSHLVKWRPEGIWISVPQRVKIIFMAGQRVFSFRKWCSSSVIGG